MSASSGDEFVDAPDDQQQLMCNLCSGGPFKGARGLKIHHSKRHRSQVRAAVIAAGPPIPGPSVPLPAPPLHSPPTPSDHPPPDDDIPPPQDPSPSTKVARALEELSVLEGVFSSLLSADIFDVDVFSRHVSDLQTLLRSAVDILPGPKHPSTKYYNARKSF